MFAGREATHQRLVGQLFEMKTHLLSNVGKGPCQFLQGQAGFLFSGFFSFASAVDDLCIGIVFFARLFLQPDERHWRTPIVPWWDWLIFPTTAIFYAGRFVFVGPWRWAGIQLSYLDGHPFHRSKTFRPFRFKTFSTRNNEFSDTCTFCTSGS